MVGTYQGAASVGNLDAEPLRFGSGEASIIKELLGIALSMESLKVYPEQIDQHFFTLKFHENGTLTLCASDREGEVTFSWKEGDEMILRIEDAYKMIMNERQVGSAGMKPVSSYSDAGEPFL
jgi:hypothetical protein